MEGEVAVKDGKSRWEYIGILQQVYAGSRPTRPSDAVRKEDGQLTQDPMELLQS